MNYKKKKKIFQFELVRLLLTDHGLADIHDG